MGDALAQFHMGSAYSNGDGVMKNGTEALKWYRLAADQGYANAQNNLGAMYYAGDGVIQDFTEAAKWYRLAAEQGVEIAQLNLGLAYRVGEGVPQDDSCGQQAASKTDTRPGHRTTRAEIYQ